MKSSNCVAEACYDLVHYERLLDYTVAPPPSPLSAADAVWLAERLAAYSQNLDI